MRPAQRIVLAVGILVFLALGLFPPYVSVTSSGSSLPGNGFRSIFLPSVQEKVAPTPTTTPDPNKKYFTTEELGELEHGSPLPIRTTYHIDYPRLVAMLGIVAIVTGAGMFLFKR